MALYAVGDIEDALEDLLERIKFDPVRNAVVRR